MASQPPKKPFAISFGKASGAAKPKVELKVQEKPDGPERVAATSISQESLARLAAEASGEVKKDLVIPMRPSKSFRAAAEAAAAAHAAPAQADASLSAEDAAALAALKASVAPENAEKEDSGLVIKARPSATFGAHPAGSAGAAGSLADSDEESLAEEPDDDDYDAVPIEDFGAAMLRGMGWQPGGAVGLTNARVVAPVDLAEGHNGRLGLGADAKVVELKKQLAKAEKAAGKGKPSAPTAASEPATAPKVLGGARSAPLTVGCLVEVRVAPHRGLFGRVSHVSAAAEASDSSAAAAAAAAAVAGSVLPDNSTVSVRLNISRALVSSLCRSRGDFDVLDESALPRDHQALLDYDYWERRDAQGPLRAAGAEEAERAAAEAAEKAAKVVTHANDDDDHDYSDFAAAGAMKAAGDAGSSGKGTVGGTFGPHAPTVDAAQTASAPLPTASSASSSSSSVAKTVRAPTPLRPWRWLHEGLRVRLVSRSFREFQRRKGLVTRVSDRSLTAYLALDPLSNATTSGGARGLTRGREEDIIDVSPEEERGLETVIPQVGGVVAVISGEKVGLVGKVAARDSDREKVTVIFGDGSEGIFSFDDVCEYEERASSR